MDEEKTKIVITTTFVDALKDELSEINKLRWEGAAYQRKRNFIALKAIAKRYNIDTKNIKFDQESFEELKNKVKKKIIDKLEEKEKFEKDMVSKLVSGGFDFTALSGEPPEE